MSKRTFSRWIVFALFGFALPIPTWGQEGGLSRRSYQQARHTLERGIAAMGGETLLRAKTLWRKLRGTGFNQGQSLRPEGPYHTRPIEVTFALDRVGRRLAEETATVYIGGTPVRNRQILDLATQTGYVLNLVARAATPLTPLGIANIMAALRRYPDLLLQRAQERAETLRWLAEENIEGKRYHVIAFAESDGTLVTLFFDAETGLLAKCETFADHPIFGDTVTELLFFDYRLVAGVTWPFRLVVRNAGEIVQDLSYAEVQIDTPLNEDFFTPPSGVAYGPPMGDPTSVDITPLAEGVYFIGGSTYNSLAVAFDKFLLVIEAPVGEERSEAVLSELKKLAPEKPVRYIVPTHYHIDHLGGIRRYIAEGAIVVTTPGNERFIRAVAATPHTVKPDALARAPREPHVEVFHGKRVFSDGSRTLELYDIGPNPHADEILIAYLPRERILFQSDLFNIPPVGEPVASDATRHFARKIAELGLDVALIVPGHVRLGTMDDLRKALERK